MKQMKDESELVSIENQVKVASDESMIEFQESVTTRSCVPVKKYRGFSTHLLVCPLNEKCSR